MNTDSQLTMNMSAVAAGSSPNGIRRRSEGIKTRFGYTIEEQLGQGLSILAQERSRERARIARELHDTLFQGFWTAALLLHNIVEAMPVHSLQQQLPGNTMRVIRRVLEEGRSVFQGPRAPEFATSSIEQELSGFLKQFSKGAARCEVSVAGHPKQLKPAIQEQINLIGREALLNALRHSEATCIEAEVEYLPRRLRVVVRDNGRGIDPQVTRTGSDAHRGLKAMRELAESIGAKLAIWSRPGAGTEVEISVPN
jgi:signal transduction histidine kinase